MDHMPSAARSKPDARRDEVFGPLLAADRWSAVAGGVFADPRIVSRVRQMQHMSVTGGARHGDKQPEAGVVAGRPRSCCMHGDARCWLLCCAHGTRGANGFRKSPDYRELSYLRSIQGWADPFHTKCARSARAGTRFSKVSVAAFLHCGVTLRRPRAALTGPGSHVAVGRRQPPPELPAASPL